MGHVRSTPPKESLLGDSDSPAKATGGAANMLEQFQASGPHISNGASAERATGASEEPAPKEGHHAPAAALAANGGADGSHKDEEADNAVYDADKADVGAAAGAEVHGSKAPAAAPEAETEAASAAAEAVPTATPKAEDASGLHGGMHEANHPAHEHVHEGEGHKVHADAVPASETAVHKGDAEPALHSGSISEKGVVYKGSYGANPTIDLVATSQMPAANLSSATMDGVGGGGSLSASGASGKAAAPADAGSVGVAPSHTAGAADGHPATGTDVHGAFAPGVHPSAPSPAGDAAHTGTAPGGLSQSLGGGTEGKPPAIRTDAKRLAEEEKGAPTTPITPAVHDAVKGAVGHAVDHAEAKASSGHQETVREYLDHTIVPVLRQALRELAVARPADPHQWLSDFILSHRPASAAK